ncbi:hypothetical protein [Providencia alcalifaciens]|uniref:hypothetical protein n=1 Tax=Providencia alcalifaciens TaxID=126385 RepID=UPI002B061E1F|nr:hypothetical protein [Providencia alcalifaciens]
MNKSIICNNKHDTEYFNSRILGGVLVSADIFTSPCVSESAAEVIISDPDLYEKICHYAFLNGEDLQSLFQDDEYTYMSCFIRDVKAFQSAFENERVMKELFNHDKGNTDHFLISFPEMSMQSQDVKVDYLSMMFQAEVLFKHLDNDNLSNIALEKLDCHVLITGGKGLEEKFLLGKNTIPNSKYFNFIKLSENTDWKDPYILSDENLPYLGDDIMDCQEKTVILNAVDSTIGFESKVFQFLEDLRRQGKRMIVVMYPDYIDTVKSLFDVVITLSVDKFGFERVKNVELIP